MILDITKSDKPGINGTTIEVTEDDFNIVPVHLTKDNVIFFKSIWIEELDEHYGLDGYQEDYGVYKATLASSDWYGVQLNTKGYYSPVDYDSMDIVQGKDILQYIKDHIDQINHPEIVFAPVKNKNTRRFGKCIWLYVLNSAHIDCATVNQSIPYKLGRLDVGTDTDIGLYNGAYSGPNHHRQFETKWEAFSDIKNGKHDLYGDFLHALNFYHWYAIWQYRLTGHLNKLYTILYGTEFDTIVFKSCCMEKNILNDNQNELYRIVTKMIDNVYNLVHSVEK